MEKFCTINSNGGLEASMSLGKNWNNGSTVTIGFVNGTDEQKEMVITYASEWLKIANIRFDWVVHGGQVRILFNPGGGSNSYVGTDCLNVMDASTVNFGWLDRKVIKHEFGHVLGLNHNHMSRNMPYHFNREKVIQRFSGPPNNWNLFMIESNILNKVTGDVIETPWESRGVMEYYFDKDLIVEGIDLEPSDEFSQSEIALIKEIYPGK